jgi:hypothetical protein
MAAHCERQNMNFLDWLENFSKEYNLIGVGLVLLLAAFLGSFLLKTAWGLWDNRNATEKFDKQGHRVKGDWAVCRKCLKAHPKKKMVGSVHGTV